MGPAISKTFSTTELINSAVSNVLVNMSSNCSSDLNTNQTIVFENITMKGSCPLVTGGITQTANVGLNFKCIQNNSNATDLQSKLSAELFEQLQNKLEGLNLGTYTNAEVESITRLHNNIVSNINMTSIAKCIGSMSINQSIPVRNINIDCSTDEKKTALISGGITQTIVASLMAECTQGNSNIASLSAELDALIKKKIDNSNSGLSSTAIFAGLIVFGIIGLVILAIVLGFNPFSWIMSLFN